MGSEEIVILTKAAAEGKSLKDILMTFSDEFKNIDCLTPTDLIKSYDYRYIFSTWYMPELTKEQISSSFPNLECVFYAAGTVQYFAQPFLEKGIRVFNSSSANGIPVAEFTASQIILANKGYFQAQAKYRKTVWSLRLGKSRRISELKAGNFNSYVGIIGCGVIGSKVIELLRPYDLNILVYDPFVSDEKLELLGAKRSDLDTLFRMCDVISNHLPDIETTRGLIGYELLSKMKPSATFINTGRGRQVIEKDLAKVMRKNKNMCALLDVTTHEPLFPWSPLYFCKNVFITPHIAGSLSGEFGRIVKYMVDAYHSVRNGELSEHEVFIDTLCHKA